MEKIYDLHCHSTVSDGVLTPTEVVQRAYAQGVNVLALTDHDSVSGLDEAKIAADKCGIDLISGVEISTQWENRGIHIVGLGMTRAHYARYLVQIGKVSNDNQAFKKYLSQGKSCYVKTEWCDIPSAIDVIHQAGGVAVLAHPLRYDMTAKKIRQLIADFAIWGGDALEVSRKQLANWAKEQELAGSVGSDFHFPCSWVELGKSLYLPEEVQPVWNLF